MSAPSLYARMREHGTLTETPKDIPDAVFALPSTLNWMKALAILTTELGVDFQNARTFYQRVQRRDLAEPQLNSVFEQLLFSLNQLAALRALTAVPNKADVARVGIVTWYYGVYGAASAMIAAADGSFPETHAMTALQWDRQFANPKLAMPPFADRLSSVKKTDADAELAAPRSRGQYSLTTTPTTLEQAWGCSAEYLSGTAAWERWNQEQRVRSSPAFKALEVEDFRTKAARGTARRRLRPKEHLLPPRGVPLSRQGQLSGRHLSRLRQVCLDPGRWLHRRSGDRAVPLLRHGRGLQFGADGQGPLDRVHDGPGSPAGYFTLAIGGVVVDARRRSGPGGLIAGLDSL